jgi:EpsI family protein
MFIMFWIGSYWREDTDVPPAAAGAARADAGAPGRIPAMVACVVVLCAVWPAFALYGEHANHNPAKVELAHVAVNWPEAPAFADWKPDYMAPDAALRRSYRQGANPVDLNLLYYRNQDRSKSLISSINRLAGYKDSWHETASTKRTVNLNGVALTVRETVLRSEGRALLVWDWMRIGGRETTSNAVGKLLQAQSKLLLRGDDGAAVMLSAPFDEQPDAARATLLSFLLDNYKNINDTLNSAGHH